MASEQIMEQLMELEVEPQQMQSSSQVARKMEEQSQRENEIVQGQSLESSSYKRYNDLDGYKRQDMEEQNQREKETMQGQPLESSPYKRYNDLDDYKGREMKEHDQREKVAMQGLPLESSPYVRYDDLEDYKRQGYGAEGHLQPKPHRSMGTDAPTEDGSGMTEQKEVDLERKLK